MALGWAEIRVLGPWASMGLIPGEAGQGHSGHRFPQGRGTQNATGLEVFNSRLDILLAGWAQTSLIQPWGRRRD